jgi:threonine aldolase
MVDLRSDTKTLPCDAMRVAIANADLGDDVSGEDPTVNALERLSAELLGKEAAIMVTSGTQGNLTSIYAQTRPGDELVCHETAHINYYERGGFAAVCGLLSRPLPGRHGALDPDDVRALFGRKADIHYQRVTLVCLENTNNVCGGTCLTAEQIGGVADVAHEYGARVHIDGARIFNAQVALGVPAADLAAKADSITFCFSKGLGAPVGSVVCGSEEFVQRVREARKLFGGGLRQAGIIAAGGLYALQHNVERLADDHAHARRIAEVLAGCRGVEVDLGTVQTNIVYFAVRRDDLTAPQLCERLGEYGVKAGARDDHSIRFVTHLDITDADTELICQALQEALA